MAVILVIDDEQDIGSSSTRSSGGRAMTWYSLPKGT